MLKCLLILVSLKFNLVLCFIYMSEIQMLIFVCMLSALYFVSIQGIYSDSLVVFRLSNIRFLSSTILKICAKNKCSALSLSLNFKGDVHFFLFLVQCI